MPKPVAPLDSSPLFSADRPGPAISRWAHGRPPVNSRRNSAAMIEPGIVVSARATWDRSATSEASAGT